MAQVGLEPTASLVLSESGLPDCLPSQASLPCCQRALRTVPGVGVEPTRAGSRPASLPLADPGIARVPGGSRTRLSGLGDRRLGRSATGTSISGRRGSRTLKGLRPRPSSKRVPSPVGLPFRAQSGWLDLNQRSRASEARHHSGLVHIPILTTMQVALAR